MVEGLRDILTRIRILEDLEMARLMGKESIPGTMERSTMVNGTKA